MQSVSSLRTAAPSVAVSRSTPKVVCMAVGPRHKGAKHHARSRPIKYNPSDRRRGPATYPAAPAPPPEVVVVSKPASK